MLTASAIMIKFVVILFLVSIPERKATMYETAIIVIAATTIEIKAFWAPKITGKTGMSAPTKYDTPTNKAEANWLPLSRSSTGSPKNFLFPISVFSTSRWEFWAAKAEAAIEIDPATATVMAAIKTELVLAKAAKNPDTAPSISTSPSLNPRKISRTRSG